MNAADSIGPENVEKNSATDVTTSSCDVEQRKRLQQLRVDDRRLDGDLRESGLEPEHQAEDRVERRRHHRDVHEQRERQADELADDELVAAKRLDQEVVDAPAIDLLPDEADADEDGDEQPEHRRGGQAEVLDDLDVLARP